MLECFQTIGEIRSYIKSKKIGSIKIIYKVSEKYSGIVESVSIIFDTKLSQITLNVAWKATGINMDFEESYEYYFKSLEELLEYVEKVYNLKIQDIRKEFKLPLEIPLPWHSDEKTKEYQRGWKDLQKDFAEGRLLDRNLKLIDST